jgi:hypothetical protein
MTDTLTNGMSKTISITHEQDQSHSEVSSNTNQINSQDYTIGIDTNQDLSSTKGNSIGNESTETMGNDQDYAIPITDMGSTTETKDQGLILAKDSINEYINNKDKDYDDLPDLKHIEGETIMNSLLKGSMETIGLLDSYISSNNIKVEDYTPSHRSTDNYYILNNKAYYLSLEQWAIVYDIIGECKNLDTVRKTVSKNPIMTKGLSKDIEKAVISLQQAKDNTIYHNVIKSFEIPIVCKIISKSLNYILIKHYSKKDAKPKEIEVSYSTICKSIGDLIGKFYIEKHLLQNNNELIKEITKKKSSVYSQSHIDPAILLTLVEKIKANTITIEDYASTFKLNITDNKLFDYLNASLYLNELEEGNITSIEEINLTKDKLNLIKEKFVIQIGSIIVESLIDNNILTKRIDSWKVPMISFNNDMEVELYTSATFYKPSLVKVPIDISYKHKLDNKMSITLNVDRRKVKHSENTHLNPSPKLRDILKDNPEMTISSEEYKEFIRYTLEIMNKDFAITDSDILNFLWIYGYRYCSF